MGSLPHLAKECKIILRSHKSASNGPEERNHNRGGKSVFRMSNVIGSCQEHADIPIPKLRRWTADKAHTT